MKQQSDQMQEDNKYKWNNKNETEVWKDEKKMNIEIIKRIWITTVN